MLRASSLILTAASRFGSVTKSRRLRDTPPAAATPLICNGIELSSLSEKCLWITCGFSLLDFKYYLLKEILHGKL
jgi:hypothetical protein